MLSARSRTRLGVLGWPVAHSRSPAIQNAALRAAGLGHWRYQLLPVPPEAFAQTVKALAAAGLRGANVTIPHKQAALALADQATDGARAIGAANTLLFGDAGVTGAGDTPGSADAVEIHADNTGAVEIHADNAGAVEIHADNTDAPALIGALPFTARARSALVLGAGGSARAAVWALLAAGASEVRVWNRTPARARQLCSELGATPADAVRPADMLVHCTSVGLRRSDDVWSQLPLAPGDLGEFACVVDLVYRDDGDTALIDAARARSIPAVDGLELLIGQGALSFERFTGREAPLEAMRAAVARGGGAGA